jgi:hypothetical protein
MNRPSDLGVDVAEPWCSTAKAPLLSQGSSAPRSHRLPGRGRLCNSGKCGDLMWPLGARQLWRSCHLAVTSVAGSGASTRKKIYSNANTRFQLLEVMTSMLSFPAAVIA